MDLVKQRYLKVRKDLHCVGVDLGYFYILDFLVLDGNFYGH